MPPPLQHAIDFVAYDRKGRIVLLMETSATHGTSEDWAARFRRNILSHGLLPESPYFLIATPEQMYFWKQEGIEPIEVPPTFSVDADQVLGPYFRKFSLDPKKIAREAFDLLLMTWLTDIAFLEQHQTSQETQPEWLAEFATSLKEAHIEMSDV